MVAVQLKPDEVKFADIALDSVAGDGTFTGYASLFETPDLSGDIVSAGAFEKSLKRRGASGVRMLFQHDPAEPIGTWTDIREDARGLFAAGRINADVARGREVLSLMRSGGLDGLSIGFSTVKSRREASGLRRLLEVDLWEISVVTFPMLPQARVAAVKGGHLPSEREFERWLTRDAKFSRTQARTIIAAGFKALKTRRDAGERAGQSDIATAIRRATHLFAS
ncbi:MAG: HK97 family phage prohead protease [Rhodobiaceae bacterium]|nr:HK97 family phage prohead protease [Rhodobiaceae bacterium]MCC0012908.1 HK97 family phage prohead protease [Rhodobiaceae bacterium]MCC0018971.1 HK97 family phage prohead protease [Rhodobiaceae bacterium]MCC0051088.1 HK97 family phage prohead protease [Rhodobiaceae bacterium]MCC0060065.1 HK97 family phage prohead protease [Rhodobiaceae bacterium]